MAVSANCARDQSMSVVVMSCISFRMDGLVVLCWREDESEKSEGPDKSDQSDQPDRSDQPDQSDQSDQPDGSDRSDRSEESANAVRWSATQALFCADVSQTELR